MLSDEDKQWLSDLLEENVQRKLEQHRIGSLETLEQHRIAFLELLELQRIALLERIERVETTLLTEFHKWASPVELRARSHAAALRAMDAEIESLGDRVKRLEDEPPAA